MSKRMVYYYSFASPDGTTDNSLYMLLGYQVDHRELLDIFRDSE